MRRKKVEYLLAVLDATPRGDFDSEDALGASVVRERMELERSVLLRLSNAPPGEAPGHLAHVDLGVAAVDPECVKLEQFAGVVFVEPELAALGRGEALAGRGPVVEVEEHRRVVGHGAEEISKTPEEVRADRLPLVGGDHPPNRAFVRRDVEVVEPEVDQRLLELALALGGPNEPSGDELRADL